MAQAVQPPATAGQVAQTRRAVEHFLQEGLSDAERLRRKSQLALACPAWPTHPRRPPSRRDCWRAASPTERSGACWARTGCACGAGCCRKSGEATCLPAGVSSGGAPQNRGALASCLAHVGPSGSHTHRGYRSRSMEADDGPDAAAVVHGSTMHCMVLQLC